eukprot:3197199-Rhodomonas_salina.1
MAVFPICDSYGAGLRLYPVGCCIYYSLLNTQEISLTLTCARWCAVTWKQHPDARDGHHEHDGQLHVPVPRAQARGALPVHLRRPHQVQ